MTVLKIYVSFFCGSTSDTGEIFQISIKKPKWRACDKEEEGIPGYWVDQKMSSYTRKEIVEWLGDEIKLPEKVKDMICLVAFDCSSVGISCEEG